MIDQYKEELSGVHAPADLIARTKAAIKIEEERINSEKENDEKISSEKVSPEKTSSEKEVSVPKKKPIVIYRYLSVAAAAVVLLLLGAGTYLQNHSERMNGLAGGIETPSNASELKVIEETDSYTVSKLEGVDFSADELQKFKDCEEVEQGDFTYRSCLTDKGMEYYVNYMGEHYLFAFKSGNPALTLQMVELYFEK